MSLKDRFNSINSQPLNKTEIKEKVFQKPQDTTDKVSSISILNTLLEDDEISSIYVNGAKNVYIERKKKLHKSTITFKDNAQLENLIHKYGQLNNYKNEKYIKFIYKMGVNAFATLPPLTDVPTLYIKCYKDKFANFDCLEMTQSLSKEISLFLEALTKKSVNVIIAGDKKTFKTTLLNAIENKTQTVNRCVNVDFSKEIQIEKNNFTNYDLTGIETERKVCEILESIMTTNPEKIFINDCDEENLDVIIKHAINGLKGICLNINANSKEEAIEKIIIEILKSTPSINYDLAKMLAHKAFDFVVFVQDKEKREVSSVSEIKYADQKCSINDIFLLNGAQKHYSTGYVPDIFLEEEESIINLNIFNQDYNHTYKEAINFDDDYKNKGINPDILKKFKKETPVVEETISQEQEQEEKTDFNSTSELVTIKSTDESLSEQAEPHLVNISDDEAFMRKAQEKFEEIRKKNLNNF